MVWTEPPRPAPRLPAALLPRPGTALERTTRTVQGPRPTPANPSGASAPLEPQLHPVSLWHVGCGLRRASILPARPRFGVWAARHTRPSLPPKRMAPSDRHWTGPPEFSSPPLLPSWRFSPYVLVFVLLSNFSERGPPFLQL